MTERTLLLRCANEGKYTMLATDFPSARVFDTTTSRLASVVELPVRSRTSLAALSLTSVALGSASSSSSAKSAKKASGAQKNSQVAATVCDANLVDSTYAAAGLSNGTVLLHDVTKDELLGHVAVSDTQHAIIAMAMRAGYLFCLAANCALFVVDMHNLASAGNGVVLKIRTQPDASTVAILDEAAAEDSVHADTHKNEEKGAEEEDGHCVLRVLVAGPSYVLHRVELFRNNTIRGKRNVAEKLLSFASQGTAVDYAWLGRGHNDSNSSTSNNTLAAVTASANEGVVRVWDMSTATETAAAPAVARCRRTLLCGQRIANVSLLDLSGTSTKSDGARGSIYVLATTFTGTVLIWNLGEKLLPRVVEPAPLQPTGAFFSDSPAARLLYATLVRQNSTNSTISNNGGDVDSATTTTGTVTATGSGLGDADLSLLLTRGRFALPQFECASVQNLIADQEKRLNSSVSTTGGALSGRNRNKGGRAQQLKHLRRAASALGLGISPSLIIVEVPARKLAGRTGSHNRNADENTSDAASNAFEVMDSAWVSNRHRLAAKALLAPTESFAATHAWQATSMRNLPVSQLTLEQRLRLLSGEVAKAAAVKAKNASKKGPGGEEDDGEKGSNEAGESDDADDADAAAAGQDEKVRHEEEEEEEEEDNVDVGGVLPSLGLATVPLYQALHANDTSAVMELLSVSARSPAGMRATVLSLQLPYALQLVSILSKRLGITSAKATVGATEAATAVIGGGGGLTSVSTRSPLLLWLDTLLQYRGMELYAAQLNAGAVKSGNESAKLTDETAQNAAADKSASTVSPPKDFIAPVLHQYRAMCANYDRLAALHGRLSIFSAVRPSEKNQFVNRPRKMLTSNIELAHTPAAASGKTSTTHIVQDDDILFPAMFTELRTSKGPHVVRVRSKLAKEKAHRRATTSDRALLKKAKQMAKEDRKRRAAKGGLLDSDGDGDGLGLSDELMGGQPGGDDEDIDLEALEAMGLGLDESDEEGSSHSSLSHSDEDEGEEDEDEEGVSRSKKARKESRRGATTAEMLADAPSSLDGDEDDDEDDDLDAELDSSDAGAEFDKASDDGVHSDVLDFSDKERSEGNSSDDDDEEESDSADEVGDSDPKRSFEDDDDDEGSDGNDDDGMGEDMVHMLAEMDGDDEEAKRETRKSKRVRTDQ